jgi:DNA repair photolyase
LRKGEKRMGLLYNNYKSIYNELNFKPRILTMDDLKDINVSEDVKKRAIAGSKLFKDRIDNHILFPRFDQYHLEEIDVNEKLLIHNYTGACPIETYEINPVKSCNVGCMYCLVDDGLHPELVVYENYHELVAHRLEEDYEKPHFYYFSPKTEAFCEATLETGVAHRILQAFIDHFKKHPKSKARIFIASKAGVEALHYRYNGVSILDLFKQLKGRMQFNTSLSIFPGDARFYIEPFASSIENRLEAIRTCQENGILANSALVQPILIHLLNDEVLNNFFKQLSDYGIKNFKPEFLTANIENIVLLSMVLEMYDKDILKKLLEMYFSDENLDHVKQRGRTAPNRDVSLHWFSKMKDVAEKYGISMSICFWVRSQLKLSEEFIPIINKNGFKCLGYQTKLFEEVL